MTSPLPDERIGIDLVMDEVEIQLGREREMLSTNATEEPYIRLDEAYTCEAQLAALIAELTADIDRKQSAEAIDSRMVSVVSETPLSNRESAREHQWGDPSVFSRGGTLLPSIYADARYIDAVIVSQATLKPSIDLKPHLDSVTLRPRSAHDVERWRDRTDALLEKAVMIISEVDALRDEMVKAASSADVFINKYAEDVDDALQAKSQSSINARIQIQRLLEATKEEIQRVTTEAATLEAAIEQKASPLKYATTRLQERRNRPSMEKTIDHVHEALIQEVAELDNSVSALQQELNINTANLEDLRAMESMLEEDFGIKKVTVNLEARCIKLRAYLKPNADQYVVNRMLEQDDFLDLMTR